MTKEEAQKACTIGLSEDINGKFYTIYDFDKLWDIFEDELIELQKNYEECKQTVAVLVDKYCKPIDEDKLDELAKNYATISTLNERDWKIAYDGYDAGYRKAMEGKE